MRMDVTDVNAGIAGDARARHVNQRVERSVLNAVAGALLGTQKRPKVTGAL